MKSLVLISTILIPVIAFAQKVDLVKDGKSDYAIVLGTNASPSQQRGAEELRSHIQQMTGADLKIVKDNQPATADEIVVGVNRRAADAGLNPDLKPLGPDGFTIKTVGTKIFILGSPVRGTMYGCSELLERMGVRWLTAKVTVLPKSKDLSLDAMDVTQVPAFEYREPYMTEAWDKDWAARNRVVGHSPHLDQSTGGTIRYADFVHTFDRLIPPGLYAKHPEYFPLVGGKRINGYVQRCLTNPDVLKLAIEGVEKAFHDNPDAIITSVSQNDTDKWCECPQCTKIVQKYGGVQSGLYLWFVNQVAAAVEKDYPDKLIDTLAYQFTEAPPKNITPRHNVRVRLCPIYCCESHVYTQCSDPPTKAFVQRLHDWHQLADVLYIWHYNTNFGHYLMPFPDFKQFPSSIRLYKNSGVKGIFFEGAYGGPGGSDNELRAYVMAKCLWNPDSDSDKLVTEWMQGVYGPAWKPMREWFDLVQAQFVAPDAHMHCYGDEVLKRLTPEILSKGSDLLDQADKLSQTDLQREYIKKVRMQIEYTQLLKQHDTGDRFKKFMADAKSLGVTHASEGQSLDDWAANYQKQGKK